MSRDTSAICDNDIFNHNAVPNVISSVVLKTKS